MERIRLNAGRLLPLITFGVMLAMGLLLFRDYGMSWDEEQSRLTGMVSARYVLSWFAPGAIQGELLHVPLLSDYADRDYGVGFELPAYLGERLLGLAGTQSIYFFRHLLTYLVFLAGVFATYGIATRRHGWPTGLMAALLLYLTPRFFAESFYNNKDIVFMAAFVLAAFTLQGFWLRPNFKTATLHAIATAWALDIRIMAIVLFPATLFLVADNVWRDRSRLVGFAGFYAFYLILTLALHVATFPYLWADPITNFITVIQNMSHFRWTGEERYFGTYIDGTHPPWHYPLVWIAITTPVLILLLFLAGAVRWLKERNIFDFAMLGFVIVPVAAVILLQSTLYDGWRHLYFIYPFIVLIAVNGGVAIWNVLKGNRFAPSAVLVVLAVHFIWLGAWMVRAHPYQNLYFNLLAGSDPRQNFEMDYWGLANRRAFEYIVTHDDAPLITVAPASLTPLPKSVLMLPPDQQRRIITILDQGFADYILTNYKRVDDFSDAPLLASHDLVYQADVDGMRIVSLYRKRLSASSAAATP